MRLSSLLTRRRSTETHPVVSSVSYAPAVLSVENMRNIQSLMTGEVTYCGLGHRSLVSQLGNFILDPRPEVVAFTLDSASPVGDVIRAVYESARIPEPLLIGIKCGQSTSAIHEKDPTTKTAELERISTLIDGRSSAVIIDQHVSSGWTIRYAASLLQEAGITKPITVCGNWYEDIGEEGRNQDEIANLTSVYSRQMHQIGNICYEKYLETQTN